jgi:hypothetical protein
MEYDFDWSTDILDEDIVTATYQFQVNCNQPGIYRVMYQLFRVDRPFEVYGNVPWISSAQVI